MGLPRILLLLLAVAAALPAADKQPDPLTQGTMATVAPDAYLLFPGDRIVVNVFGHDDLNHFIRIPQTGPVSFPLIGRIEAIAGRRVEALREEIAERLGRDYVVDPRVTISVVEFAPRAAFVTGSVLRPDSVALEALRDTSAQQAIARCGGFADDADRERSLVLRDDPANAGAKRAIPVPNLAEGGHDVVLQPGDIVVVPRFDRVYVLGRVNRAGHVNLPSQERLTVSKAISLAGGFDRYARTGQVQLLRAGAPTVAVDVEALLAGDARTPDPELHPGDTVFVPASRF